MVFRYIKKLFEPKIGSSRWLKNASKDDVLTYRDALQKIFMDPKCNKIFREKIQTYLPYLDKIISKKD